MLISHLYQTSYYTLPKLVLFLLNILNTLYLCWKIVLRGFRSGGLRFLGSRNLLASSVFKFDQQLPSFRPSDWLRTFWSIVSWKTYVRGWKLPALWVFRVKESNGAISFPIESLVAKLSNGDFSHMIKKLLERKKSKMCQDKL